MGPRPTRPDPSPRGRLRLLPALAAPGAPAITTPAGGLVTNQTELSVSGTAETSWKLISLMWLPPWSTLA